MMRMWLLALTLVARLGLVVPEASSDSIVPETAEAALPEAVAHSSATLPRRITVSGQSAGASQALQHLVAFSSSVKGAAILAGSPYGCGNLPAARIGECFGYETKGGYNGYHSVSMPLQEMVEVIKQRFAKGLIDDPEHLKHTPVLLFNGASDHEVTLNEMRSVEQQLSHFVGSSHLHLRFGTKAGHVWPVDHGECGCGACKWGYVADPKIDTDHCCNVNNCHYDLSGEMFQLFYGRAIQPRSVAHHKLHWIEQWQYVPHSGPHGKRRAGVSRWGIAYVPRSCQRDTDKCSVHVNYHGCMSNKWLQRIGWVRSININEYAEANHVVVVYPQDEGDARTGRGCWNWGDGGQVDDPSFDTKGSLQLGMVNNMLRDLPGALSRSVVSEEAPSLLTTDAEVTVAGFADAASMSVKR